jgi:hypothetical protein
VVILSKRGNWPNKNFQNRVLIYLGNLSKKNIKSDISFNFTENIFPTLVNNSNIKSINVKNQPQNCVQIVTHRYCEVMNTFG